MSIFDALARRERAEVAARAHERLRALVAVDSPRNQSDSFPHDEHDVRLTDQLDGWRIGPAALVGLVVVLVVAVAAAAFFAWRGRARDVGGGLAPLQAPQATSSGAATATNGSVVVDVAGRVRRPGLVTVPAGARVADVLRLAGGALPGTDLTSLNLARKVVDGEQIVVGAPAGVAGGSSSSPGPTNPVSLNTGSVSDLDQLPGVGPVLAQRIVEWRTAHGGFTSVSQLRQVTGIGDSKYADLQPLVRV